MLKKIKTEEKEKKSGPTWIRTSNPLGLKKFHRVLYLLSYKFLFTKCEKKEGVIHFDNFANLALSKFFLFLVTFWFLDNIYRQFPLRYFNDQSTDSSQCKKKCFCI